MTRKMYEPTKNQERRWTKINSVEMPSDEEFKSRWAKSHHGKTRGWGMGKRNWVLSQMTGTREYQMGLWQGRVDKARGLDYGEQRNENTYNLGYHRGYTEYESNRRGWDRATRARFDAKYVDQEIIKMPHGQLWQPCFCGTEPVCLDCECCERHCTC